MVFVILMVLLPPLHPLSHPLHICIQILDPVALQLHHNLGIVRIPRLLQQHLHNLRIHVFLNLPSRVFARSKPVVEQRGVGAQHNNEVDPRLGEEVARVPVDYVPASEGFGLNGV
jgi:hypothetical protein